MKKKLVFLLLILSVVSFAQSWCPSGAEWTYSYSFPFPTSNGYVVLKYVKDSLINTKTYKKINSTFFGYNAAYGSGTVTLNQGYYLLHQNAKLISLYNGYTPDDTLFNFNANIGDKWLRTRYFNDPSCDAQRQQVTVLDTGSVIINSVSLKKLVLSYVRGTYVGGPTGNYNDTIYEKIGSINNHLVPWSCETSSFVPGKSGTFPVGNFRCYTDNFFPSYQKPGTPNCYYINSIDDFFESKKIILYPNPTSNELNFEINSNNFVVTAIELLNPQGFSIFRFPLTEKINISSLASGLYFVKFTNSVGAFYLQPIIKE